MSAERETGESLQSVLRESEALYEGRGRLQHTLDRLAGRLHDLGADFSLLGGYALVLHGVRRFTEDLDILVKASDLERLKKELIGLGYRAEVGCSRSLRDTTTGVRIDFVVSGQYPGDGRPKPVAFPDPAAQREMMQGLPVVDLRTLIELKLASGLTAPDRLQDLADVQRLIRTHHLQAGYADRLDASVRSKFVELCRSVA